MKSVFWPHSVPEKNWSSSFPPRTLPRKRSSLSPLRCFIPFPSQLIWEWPFNRNKGYSLFSGLLTCLRPQLLLLWMRKLTPQIRVRSFIVLTSIRIPVNSSPLYWREDLYLFLTSKLRPSYAIFFNGNWWKKKVTKPKRPLSPRSTRALGRSIENRTSQVPAREGRLIINLPQVGLVCLLKEIMTRDLPELMRFDRINGLLSCLEPSAQTAYVVGPSSLIPFKGFDPKDRDQGERIQSAFLFSRFLSYLARLSLFIQAPSTVASPLSFLVDFLRTLFFVFSLLIS